MLVTGPAVVPLVLELFHQLGAAPPMDTPVPVKR
jgi:hypothetical protein